MYCYPNHRYLHSFPTRRSSDLPGELTRGDGLALGIGRPWPFGVSGQRRDQRFCRELGGLAERLPGIPQQLDTQIVVRSEEHTSELQSLRHIVCRLLLEKKNKNR